MPLSHPTCALHIQDGFYFVLESDCCVNFTITRGLLGKQESYFAIITRIRRKVNANRRKNI
jgi:hypothetical protein